jgi:asparagine synthase (glutamine-hydrolysing)
MAQETPGTVRSFALGFHESSYNELASARMAATHFGTTHREAMVRPEIIELAERLAAAFDEPFADVSAFPTYLVSDLARQEVTVALSGDGGDELFAGYDAYVAHRWAARLRWLSERWPWRVIERLLAATPPTPHKKGVVNKAKRFAAGLRCPADLEHARWWVFWDVEARRALYSEPTRAELRDRDCFAYYRQRLAEGAEAGFVGLDRQLYADITGYLADDILVKLDRTSMAVSLEARVPYLAPELVEYAMGIRAAWKMGHGRRKRVLRRAFRGDLPRALRRRGKEGFSIPMKNWLRGPLRPLLDDLVNPGRVAARGWFEPREVARLVDQHLRGRENHAHTLWCLMSVELSLATLERRHAARAPARAEPAPTP